MATTLLVNIRWLWLQFCNSTGQEIFGQQILKLNRNAPTRLPHHTHTHTHTHTRTHTRTHAHTHTHTRTHGTHTHTHTHTPFHRTPLRCVPVRTSSRVSYFPWSTSTQWWLSGESLDHRDGIVPTHTTLGTSPSVSMFCTTTSRLT